MQPARLTRAFPFAVFLFACHTGSGSGQLEPEAARARREATLAAALRWIPTNTDFGGLPVVLMAGSAQGDYRPAWIDSLQSAKVIHHACTALTVAECPDSARAAYVGFNQPDLSDDRSAEVTLRVVVMNPAACSHATTEYTETTGRLHMPWVGSTLRNYRWTPKKSEEGHC
jgi:hypothetical protein